MGFEHYMHQAALANRLVVQPRMGFSPVKAMRNGLREVKSAEAVPRIGTVTVDAYTRVGQIEQASAALREQRDLNGFPIVSHGPEVTRHMLDDLRDASFPVQVRHGTAFPQAIFEAAAASGFDAIEGGPISYNLPYSRAPLDRTVEAWIVASRYWAEYGQREGIAAHLETFAGCMLGQLCPPGLLVALSILEGLFFVENGIRHLSLSLAQGTSDDQDVGAVLALRRLAESYFAGASWHIVYYTFMGLFPQTLRGAEAIIRASARIAAKGGAQRLIVKTAAEAYGIPTIEQNVQALKWARQEADAADRSISPEAESWSDTVSREAQSLISATRASGRTIAEALVAAFQSGLLDVPYCIHPSNRNVARTVVDPETAALRWGTTGAMPITQQDHGCRLSELSSAEFHDIINLNRRRYDIYQDSSDGGIEDA
ncbi:MAG: hypothetical protein WB524_06385 [Acidobacteriaceae bacterium]